MAGLFEADDRTFDDFLTEHSGRVLIDFWAPSCPPCLDIGRRLEAIAPQYANDISIVKVNADEAPETAARFGVRGLPTLVLVKAGQHTESHIGSLNQVKLDALVKSWSQK